MSCCGMSTRTIKYVEVVIRVRQDALSVPEHDFQVWRAETKHISNDASSYANPMPAFPSSRVLSHFGEAKKVNSRQTNPREDIGTNRTLPPTPAINHAFVA